MFAGLGSLLPTACDGGSTTIVDALPEHGQLQLNLIGVSNAGNAYRLRQAIIVVQGSSSTTFLNSDEDPDSTRLGASVAVGVYSAFLQEGWFLERLSDSGGTPQPLQATLLSPNPVGFSVAGGRVHARSAALLRRKRNGGCRLVRHRAGGRRAVVPGDHLQHGCGLRLGANLLHRRLSGQLSGASVGQACPLPDLTVSLDTALASLSTRFETFSADSCALQEGCVDGPGVRRLLAFSTQTANIGGSDIILGDPTTTPGFEFASCHGHFHFEGYAQYQLLDAAGAVAATGHKQAFCLLDSEAVGIPGAPTTPRFHCGFQGIQRGWSDVYGSGLDCQWVDITDVAEGDYTLRISINPDRVIAEADFTNNSADSRAHRGAPRI